MGSSGGRLLLVLVAFAAIVLGGAVANAERSQKQGVIVSLNGGIAPRKLPRDKPAPVAVHLSGRVTTENRMPVPRVNWVRLELAWHGLLDTKGLPVCPRARL